MSYVKKLEQIQAILSASKKELRKKYKVKEFGIFDSYIRGEQKKSSDADIFIRFKPDATLFDLVGMGNYLEEKLRLNVDVVSEGGIRPELKEAIVKESMMI